MYMQTPLTVRECLSGTDFERNYICRKCTADHQKRAHLLTRDEVKGLLKSHFMKPHKKWFKKKRIPGKLVVHFLSIVFVTTQVGLSLLLLFLNQ